MSLFVLMCFDKADALPRRTAARADHLAYIEERLEKVKLAGPLLTEAGDMAGSLILYEAEDRAEVEAFAAGDPYKAADVFERVEISAFKVTRGALA